LRKLSGGNPEQLPHEEFIIFLDESLHNCQPILKALEQMGVQYEKHGSRFSAGAPDSQWLPFVGEKHYALLTVDRKIRYNRLEIGSIIKYGVKAFVYTSGNFGGPLMGQILLKSTGRMKRIFKKNDPPFIATISQSGAIEMRYDKDGSIHDRKRNAEKISQKK
jgi:PIN like domain